MVDLKKKHWTRLKELHYKLQLLWICIQRNSANISRWHGFIRLSLSCASPRKVSSDFRMTHDDWPRTGAHTLCTVYTCDLRNPRCSHLCRFIHSFVIKRKRFRAWGKFRENFFSAFLLIYLLVKMSTLRSLQRSALKRALGVRTYATEPVCSKFSCVWRNFFGNWY